ncbi:Arginine-binding extracellular protein ArtP precursor [Sporomusa ovata DSM 2662]|uniref:Amino acid ABC transporter, amino acid-binding protein/permease protein n=1 Tax=Sporomusa ovata TaxID=2378 RepID=A0A0U1L595_9FIRM|nr:transporter substrate-binding domain-containing protein [Sporomusa ovata]EQB28531.1 ABC transporter, substrate-binding protein, family 3 [Sporomusa ovata DSM 2662]CQR74861.1 Amino acid ABC transporter, amino acid-binding protein/permease protein [Sporomusa ovata]
MKSYKTMLRIILCLAIFAFGAMLTGCSGDQKAAEKKVFRVGMECGYAPFNWTQTTADNGAVKIKDSQEYAMGYDVMIAKKIAESMGYELEIHKIEWDGLAPAVNAGKIDAAIAGMSITSKRKETVDFSSVYYNADIVALTKKDSPFAAAKNLDGLKGAVATSQLNTVWYDLLKQIPDAKIQPAIDNVPGMIVALTSGKVEVLATDKPTAMAAVFSNPELVMLDFKNGQGFKVEREEIEMGIAVAKGKSNELLTKINKALSAMTEEDRNKLMEEAIKKQPLAKQ